MLRSSLLQLAASSRPTGAAGRAFVRSYVLDGRKWFSVSHSSRLDASQIITSVGHAALYSEPVAASPEDTFHSPNIESGGQRSISSAEKPDLVPLQSSSLIRNIQKPRNGQKLQQLVPKTTYEIAMIDNLQISRVPGGHDRPRIFGDRRSQGNLQPDITLLKTSDMIRFSLEKRFLAVDEDLDKDLIQIETHLAESFKEPGAVNLVWQRLGRLDNKNVSLILLTRIAIDRPRLFLRILSQLRREQLETTMSSPNSVEMMRQVICYVYCVLMARHVQMAQKMPAIFFEALQKLLKFDPNLLKVLPRYSLFRHCPLSLQKSFSEALKGDNLHQNHWEDDLINAQRCASDANWSGVSLHLGKVYDLCNQFGNLFPVRSLEFVNTIGRVVGYAKSRKSNIGEVINAILPPNSVGEMQALVYSRLVRYALVENPPDSSNLELILSRLPPRALSRPALVDQILNAIVLLNARPPDHRLNSHLRTVLRKNRVLATYYLSAWCLYLANSEDALKAYNAMIRLYADIFDTTLLKAIGLPHPKVKASEPRLEPTHVTLNLVLNSYFQSGNYEPEVIFQAYQSFRRSVQATENLVTTVMDGPRVYNAFLDAFARLPEKDMHLCVSLVAEITEQITEERVKSAQDGQRWRKKSHIGPDGYSWCILLKVLSGHGHWEACTRILESIRKRYPKSYDVASNTVISAFMKTGKKDEAVQLLQRMMMLGYEVDEHTVRALHYLEKDVAVTLDQATYASSKSEPP